MSKEAAKKKDRRFDYAPEWMTKSVDKVPPSEGPLVMNPVVAEVLGVPFEGNENGGQAGESPEHSPDSSNGRK